MPPPKKVRLVVGTQTAKLTVGAAATNFTNVLFSKLKQEFKFEPAQSLTPLLVVLPQSPLKSQTDVAPEQDMPVGKVCEQAGITGGCGAGVLLKVKFQLFKVPTFAAVRLSVMQSRQAPLGFWPLLTAPK